MFQLNLPPSPPSATAKQVHHPQLPIDLPLSVCLSVFQRPPENRGDFGWAPEEDPEQRPVHASADEPVSDLDGMMSLVPWGGAGEGVQQRAEVGGEELTRGSAGRGATAAWGLPLQPKDVPGTHLWLVTSVPHQQKHTYQCRGGQRLNTYKYVQIIYLKSKAKQKKKIIKNNEDKPMCVGKQTQTLETRLQSHHQ